MKSLKFLLLGVVLCTVGSPLFARSHIDFSFNFGVLPFFQPCVHERVVLAPPPCFYYPHHETIVREYYRPCYSCCPCCQPQREMIVHRHTHCCPCY